MRDMLRWAASWINDRKVESVSETVTYSREGQFSIALSATIGTSIVDTVGDGAAVTAETDDFIFDRRQLVHDGFEITPQRDDVITRTVRGIKQEKYLVLPNTSQPEQVRSDGFDYFLRVHTNRVSST